ncbi:uncharacterized protein LY89DRAFT_671443 [Mollisia scopiformis]|uniref:1-alkyl-2-acetylglycerophosphocholine esterase n=1 Tax=Mollisia scopiformis TaxID=149040 RepID=A0A194X4E1_MOLSC|nr:uncharacterized protein LY89DRAFT_671443 [Mollisia scopiformis]KUJ15048.1 hypothetical protein LY89DRAFT_671443 [Mollisia scopiformis]
MHLFSYLVVSAGLTVCAASAIASSPSQILLPKPTGLYQVGRSTAELVDHSRIQPFAPDVEPVRLEVTIFYPAVHQHHSIPGAYFPLETALIEDNYLSSLGLASPNGTFEKLALHLASNEPTQNLTGQPSCEFSLVIFSPGEGTTRLFYSQIAATIASQGFIVVTIDAPYDVDVVQYPNGDLAFINSTLWDTTNDTALEATAYLAIQTRMADVSFVLDSLSNATLAATLIPNLPPSRLNTSHAAMFGHSLGGATAYSILGTDDRIVGGLDMDGLLFGPGLPNGTSKPFMLMGHGGHTRANVTDDPFGTWTAAWSNSTNSTGWKRDIVISGTLHYDFSDYPIVFDTLGISPCNETVRDDNLLIGSLKGKRSLEIVTTYVGAFLDFVLFGKCSALLDGPVDEFPEVVFDY